MLEVGEITLANMNRENLAKIAPEFARLDGLSDEGRVIIEDAEFFERTQTKPCAFYRGTGESGRVYSKARVATRRALEALTYVNAALYDGNQNNTIIVHIAGEDVDGAHQIYGATPRGTHQSWDRDPRTHIVSINPEKISYFEALGLFSISEIIEADPKSGSFAEDILRGIHWFAVAQDQNELETKTVFLITCVEALVGPPDRNIPINNHVSEAAALILGGTLIQRIEIKRQITIAYGVRSAVAHGSTTATTEYDVDRLRSVVIRLIFALLKWRIGLRTRMDLFEWVKTARISDAPIPTPDHAPSVSELLAKHELSVEDLAEKSGLSTYLIETYISNGWRRNGMALIKLATGFDLTLFELPVPNGCLWTAVQGWELFLVSRKQGYQYEALVDVVNPERATSWPVRDVLPAEAPNVTNPAILQGRVRTHASSARRSLDLLECKVTDALERALARERLEGEPDDWVAPEPPEHWLRR